MLKKEPFLGMEEYQN